MFGDHHRVSPAGESGPGPVEPRARWRLAAGAGAVSASAWGGAAGLIAGFLDLGPEVTARLPFESPVLGGLALAGLVALPMAATAVQAWWARPRADVYAIVAGAILMAWVTVQPLVIHSLSALQAVMFAAGAAVLGAGYRHRHRRAAS